MVIVVYVSLLKLSPRELQRVRDLTRRLGMFLALHSMAQQSERRVSELSVVNDVAAELTSVIETERLFPQILQEIRRVIPYDAASLFIFHPEHRQLRIVANCGESADQRQLREDTAWERAAGLAFRSQRRVILRDWRREAPEYGTPTSMPLMSKVRSVLCVPIVFGGKSLGVISLSGRRPAAFTKEDGELVMMLANHAAIAIANAQLYKDVDIRLQSKLRDLTNLSRIGQEVLSSLLPNTVLQNIARGTAEAFGSSASSIGLLDGDRHCLVVAACVGAHWMREGSEIPLEGSAMGWIVQHGRTLFIPSGDDADLPPLRAQFELEGIKCFIGVPLVVRGNVIGTLNVYSRLTRVFEESDVALLQGLAAQAAIAIDHARLYEAEARQRARLQAIVESLTEGLLLVGTNDVVVYANERAGDLLGLGRDTLTGLSMTRIWPLLIERCAVPSVAQEALVDLERNHSKLLVLDICRPCKCDLEMQSFIVSSSDGLVLGRGYLLRDVTHRTQVERTKASILSTVSHELRAPLAAIKGFATSLLRWDTDWGEESTRDFLEQIDEECDRLNVLVRNILDMSRLDAGALRLDRDWCDLRELVEDIVDRMSRILERHSLEMGGSHGQVLVFADRRYIERVVWNLVENAAIYSAEGTKITVNVAYKGGYVALTVRDEGIGITPEDLQRIFEPFCRAEGTRQPGVGLGLAICRGIVDAHGGTITVVSEPGRGSVFEVRLPSSRDATLQAGGGNSPADPVLLIP